MLQIDLWISFKDFVTTLETTVFLPQQKNNFEKASTFEATKPKKVFCSSYHEVKGKNNGLVSSWMFCLKLSIYSYAYDSLKKIVSRRWNVAWFSALIWHLVHAENEIIFHKSSGQNNSGLHAIAIKRRFLSIRSDKNFRDLVEEIITANKLSDFECVRKCSEDRTMRFFSSSNNIWNLDFQKVSSSKCALNGTPNFRSWR